MRRRTKGEERRTEKKAVREREIGVVAASSQRSIRTGQNEEYGLSNLRDLSLL